MVTCEYCSKVSEGLNQFWCLKNYYGISGWHCSKCYARVAHDAFGNPKQPTEYLMILLKQESKNG